MALLGCSNRRLSSLAEWESLAPLLLSKGLAPIAFHRARSAGSACARAEHLFRNAYRLHFARSRVYERRVARTVELLGAADPVERVVLRAPLPRPGDASVRRRRPARGSARPTSRRGCHGARLARRVPFADFGDDVARLSGDSFEALRLRARGMHVGGQEVSGLALDDELRYACLHVLEHGADRPLWLCDVALLLEQPGVQFNSSSVLRGSPKAQAWLHAWLRLARDMLGARVAASLANEVGSEPAPAWMVDETLRSWGQLRDRAIPSAWKALRRPSTWAIHVRERWPNRIEALLRSGAHPSSRRWRGDLYAIARALMRTLRSELEHRYMRAAQHPP